MKHFVIVFLVLVLPLFLTTEVGYCKPGKDADRTAFITGTITGSTSVCKNATGIHYTVTGSGATTGYTWTVPTGATITAGAGTNVITVSFIGSAAGGTPQMFFVNGNGLSANLGVLIYAPPTSTPVISGPASVCPSQTGVVYTVSGVTDATTSFSWVPPTGASFASTSSNSATVNFSSSFTGTQAPLMYYVINGPCGTGPIVNKPVSLTILPVAPGVITGTPIVTPGSFGITYGVTALTSNVTSYQWNLPTGASTTGTGNNVSVSFSSSFAGGNVTVQGVNGTCKGPASPSYTITLTGYPVPAGTISGNTVPCAGTSGTTVTYTVPAITNATSYNWIVTGSATTAGSLTNSIDVFFPAGLSGNSATISVNGVNSSGTGPSSTINVTISRPVIAATVISGPLYACQGQTGVIFSIAPIQNATNYQWIPPTGATIASGQGTTQVTLNFSSTYASGNLSVYGVGGTCGAGPSLSTTIAPMPAVVPVTAGTITGNNVVCQGDAGVTYSVAPIQNAIGYTWSLPSGATIASGQNTNTITVNYSATAASGNVSVYGTNCFGNGTSSSMPVAVSTFPGAAGVMSGDATPCLGGDLVVYSVPAITNATGYLWTVPTGATIASGQNTNTITVGYSFYASAGSVTVSGSNCKGYGASATMAISYATSGAGNIASGRVEPSVDLVTGIMSTGIPLFSISDGDISVGAELDYTAAGVRVNDDDGWVGQNWSLSVGSYRVAREMRGLPDDYTASSPDNRKGWLIGTTATTIDNFTPNNDNNPATCTDEVTNWTTLNSLDYNQDTEPDVFYVSAPGLSFQFYFDKNRIPRALPYQDVIITPNTTTGPISSFTVKDSNGVTYTFSDNESITESVQATNAFYLVRQSNLFKNPITYTTSWRLSSMASPTYGTITFTYRTLNSTDQNLYPDWYKQSAQYKYRYKMDFSTKGDEIGALEFLTLNIGDVTMSKTSYVSYSRNSTLKIIQKISSPGMEAVFSSAPRFVGATMERLNNIVFYDKRDGSSKPVRTISFFYLLSGTDQRALLTKVNQSTACINLDYGMEYYLTTLPQFRSEEKDDWGFYKSIAASDNSVYYPYDQSVSAGSLKKITYPYKGYDVFFYEPHDYWDGTSSVQGGGMRLKKMISYDGVSSNGDNVKEYSYKAANGQSSGKIQYKALHDFSVTRLEYFLKDWTNQWADLKYREAPLKFTVTPSDLNRVYTIHTDEELSHYNMLHGSVVAYERVAVTEKDAGQSIYDFDLPASFGDASANSNEWKASLVSVARPSIAGGCYELANIQQGMDQYPFPPSPVYEFAKGLTKKITNLKEDGTVVSDIVYSYQRVYRNGTSIGKIYGLALEELPTYYYNGSSYTDNKLFLYSKYELFTDVKTELSSQVLTIYNSTDLTKKTVTTTNFFYDSPNHGELTHVETQNSDGSVFKKKLKYVKDYVISSPADVPSAGLVNMKSANRNAVVESLTTKVNSSGVEKYLGGSITVYKGGNPVYPDKQYSFSSADGSTTFVPSSVNSGTTLQFDQSNYVLENTFLSFDSYGNAAEIVDRSRSVKSIAYGYLGTLPEISFSNALLTEVKYSDFEALGISTDFTVTWSLPVYGAGRNNSRALSFPPGSASTMFLSSSLNNTNKIKNYYFSFWIQSATAGALTLQVGGTTTINCPFTASSSYQYYSVKVPVASIVGSVGSYPIKVWSSVTALVDDIAFYPEQSDFVASTYGIPNGKKSETDSRGVSVFYDHDAWGRLKTVYDRNRNVVKKYNYHVKP